MSDVLFPVMFEKCVVTPNDRTILDAMESGGSASARRMWPAYYFQRAIDIDTTKLTLQEWRYLRSFYNQRGTWDSFWFRDNPGRTGNYQVRFAKALQQTRDAALFQGSLQLLEVMPWRALPEWDEVIAAAGSQLLVAWYDANRDRYWLDAGQGYQDAYIYDGAFEKYPANDINGTLNIGNLTGQAQYYSFTGAGDQQFLSSAVSEFSNGSHPACTIFMFIRTPVANGDQQVLLSIGADAVNGGMGLQLDTAGYYKPWIGSGGTWTNAKYLNSVANTWRSVAVTWTGVDVASLIVNGTLVGSDTNTRASWPGGPIMIGATPGGNLSAEQGDIGNVLIFNTNLTAAQCKALHNLFAYQYSLPLLS